MPALCFNHVKLPIHIKAHLNSPSTLVAISLTRGGKVCAFIWKLERCVALTFLGRKTVCAVAALRPII